jgi:hypothetical protein
MKMKIAGHPNSAVSSQPDLAKHQPTVVRQLATLMPHVLSKGDVHGELFTCLV